MLACILYIFRPDFKEFNRKRFFLLHKKTTTTYEWRMSDDVLNPSHSKNLKFVYSIE